jgi:hypothetical protein
MKRYFTDNKKLFRFINSDKYDIKEIRTIRKHERKGIWKKYHISSYCIIYEKIV